MNTTYSPIPYDCREVIEEAIARKAQGKVFYFGTSGEVCSEEGTVLALEAVAGLGEFIVLEPEARVRIDRIITLFGKPGAAYDEYDAYANACLDCKGGYEE
jgi:hypothetical protein